MEAIEAIALKPIQDVWDRVCRVRDESCVEWFNVLLYSCELATKLVTLELVSSLNDEPERHRYRLEHRLVRADGIGTWNEVLLELMNGPAGQFFPATASDERRDLMEKSSPGDWKRDAVDAMWRAASQFAEMEPLPTKAPLSLWFELFVRLRNKTRGHGAPSTTRISEACPHLERAFVGLTNSYRGFKRPWAYLHQNMRGNYRVVMLGGGTSERFEKLKAKDTRATIPNGVYVDIDGLRPVRLAESDVDLSDFFVANGGFNDTRYELLSAKTGNSKHGISEPFLMPATKLPPAATEGLGDLDVRGNVLSNMPPPPEGYVPRTALERELLELLSDDRHWIVTLKGPGGVGKTSLALRALEAIAESSRFQLIVWFSARDIDLTESGPKPVRPSVLDSDGISKQYATLLGRNGKGRDLVDAFAKDLHSNHEGTTLFVFDNFETVSDPQELYNWLNTSIRSPNKILITTRFAGFKGDYEVEVGGMNEQESRELIAQTAHSLGIERLITPSYCSKLHEEAAGHPYVMKILLGDVASQKQLREPERITAEREEVLTALFERTYVRLSPAARRVFLTLASWRTFIPALAMKAVLLAPRHEHRIDVDAAIDELRNYSMVEVTESESDRQVYIRAQLAASVFGRKKLNVDVMKNTIESDVKLLHMLGPTHRGDLRHGLRRQVQKLVAEIARASGAAAPAAHYLDVLKFVATSYPPAFLFLADLLEEYSDHRAARDAVKSYIQSFAGNAANEWERVATLSERVGDKLEALHAWVEYAKLNSSNVEEISFAANRINGVARDWREDHEDKRMCIATVVAIFEGQLASASGDDFSRLAWLHMNLRDELNARRLTRRGLDRYPSNDHLQRLAAKLGP